MLRLRLLLYPRFQRFLWALSDWCLRRANFFEICPRCGKNAYTFPPCFHGTVYGLVKDRFPNFPR